MKTIEVRNQVRMPLSRCAELVLNGIRFRLFRAAITVVIISLAVAFLTTMLTESLVARNVAEAISIQTEPRRNMTFWVGRLSTPMSDDELMDQMAAAAKDSPRRVEFITWGKVAPAALDKLHETAVTQQRYLVYFSERLDENDRVRLFDRDRGNAIFKRLQSPEELGRFKKTMAQRGKAMSMGMETFEQFLKDWQASLAVRESIRAGHRKAVEAAATILAGRSSAAVLAGANASLPVKLDKLGFKMTNEEFEKVKVQAKLSLDAEVLLRTLGMSVIKQRLGGRAGVKVRNVTPYLFFREVKSSGGAKWLVEQMSEQAGKLAEARAARKPGEPLKREHKALLDIAHLIEGFNYSPERVRQVASDRLSQDKLAATEASVGQAAVKTGYKGFSPRTLWLIGVSFLVCIVGITNAMLMSVTDRFREIATMKCLGATDGFIMINFVMESCIQGTTGGILGVILGLALGALRSVANYGWISFVSFPMASVLTVAVWAIVAGVVISALAAVYPAWVAARLAPMEAMRIE